MESLPLYEIYILTLEDSRGQKQKFSVDQRPHIVYLLSNIPHLRLASKDKLNPKVLPVLLQHSSRHQMRLFLRHAPIHTLTFSINQKYNLFVIENCCLLQSLYFYFLFQLPEAFELLQPHSICISPQEYSTECYLTLHEHLQVKS